MLTVSLRQLVQYKQEFSKADLESLWADWYVDDITSILIDFICDVNDRTCTVRPAPGTELVWR